MQDNHVWSSGLPRDSVQAITALLGQDTLMNATQQQLVSNVVKLAASCIYWHNCCVWKGEVAFAFKGRFSVQFAHTLAIH